MGRKTRDILCVVFLCVCAAGCGGGGGGSGPSNPGTPGGDPNLVGTWYFEVGVHPFSEITFQAGGSYDLVLANDCNAAGTWYTGSNQVALSVAAADPICDALDVGVGDVITMGYAIDGDTLTIWDDDGSTEMYR